MEHGLTKNNKASIIHLFQKMDSDVSKFRESLLSSPTGTKAEGSQASASLLSVCGCVKNQKDRKLEGQFYRSQYDLVSKAAVLLEQQGNDTIAKILSFMSEYLLKICQLTQRQPLCDCIKRKLNQLQDLQYKINFLREQNHKFFKIIQQKTFQCDGLKQQLEVTISKMHLKVEEHSSSAPTSKSRLSEPSFVQGLSSRMISSNSSRVSEFKHVWPQLTELMGEGGHKKYFQVQQPPKTKNFKSRDNFKSRGGLFQKDLNRIELNANKHQLNFRKPKIFEHIS